MRSRSYNSDRVSLAIVLAVIAVLFAVIAVAGILGLQPTDSGSAATSVWGDIGSADLPSVLDAPKTAPEAGSAAEATATGLLSGDVREMKNTV
jgi:hypothetical protein